MSTFFAVMAVLLFVTILGRRRNGHIDCGQNKKPLR